MEKNNTVFRHFPVMLGECISGLEIKPDGIYVDCTLGGGGHSFEIARHLSEHGRLICIDQDICAIRAASKHLEEYSDRITYAHRNFSEIQEILKENEIAGVDGALIDLGVSSYQLDTPMRGFSYQHDAPLDMRMNEESSFSAYDLVNTYSREDLSRVIFTYGEEKFASNIAKRMVEAREMKPIQTTFELVDIIKSAIPAKFRERGGHPAKRTFQALRIEVNHELDIIAPTVERLIDILNPNGRLCVITFHSLEDRIVKQTFKTAAQGCTCPRDFPVCVCGHQPKIEILTHKPITASEKELEENNRSHSAKLRIARKIMKIQKI